MPPWQVLNSRQLLKDRWIDLTADTCRDARGNLVDPFYILSYPDWVQVVALTPADELVLVRQYRHGARQSTLELPAGSVDGGESAVAAGLRELREETGFVAAEGRLVSTLHPNTASCRNRCHTILALDVQPGGMRDLEPGEDISVELWPLREVLAGLPQGLMTQSTHVSALLLALHAAGRMGLELRPRTA